MTPDGHRTIGIVADVVPVVLAKSHARPDRMQQTGHPPTATWPQRLLSALLCLRSLYGDPLRFTPSRTRRWKRSSVRSPSEATTRGTSTVRWASAPLGALEAFQRSVGLPDTGEIDGETWTALGLGPVTGAEGGREPDAGTQWSEADASSTEPWPPHRRRTRTESTRKPRRPGTRRTLIEPGRTGTGGPRETETRLRDPRLASPQTGAAALARFDAIGAHPELKREKGALFVPKSEFVIVLEAGGAVPGTRLRPGSGPALHRVRLRPRRPVIFTPTGDGEYCQAGIGIVIEVGRTLAIRRIDWGDLQLPQGTVRVTLQGLQVHRLTRPRPGPLSREGRGGGAVRRAPCVPSSRERPALVIADKTAGVRRAWMRRGRHARACSRAAAIEHRLLRFRSRHLRRQDRRRRAVPRQYRPDAGTAHSKPQRRKREAHQ